MLKKLAKRYTGRSDVTDPGCSTQAQEALSSDGWLSTVQKQVVGQRAQAFSSLRSTCLNAKEQLRTSAVANLVGSRIGTGLEQARAGLARVRGDSTNPGSVTAGCDPAPLNNAAMSSEDREQEIDLASDVAQRQCEGDSAASKGLFEAVRKRVANQGAEGLGALRSACHDAAERVRSEAMTKGIEPRIATRLQQARAGLDRATQVATKALGSVKATGVTPREVGEDEGAKVDSGLGAAPSGGAACEGVGAERFLAGAGKLLTRQGGKTLDSVRAACQEAGAKLRPTGGQMGFASLIGTRLEQARSGLECFKGAAGSAASRMLEKHTTETVHAAVASEATANVEGESAHLRETNEDRNPAG